MAEVQTPTAQSLCGQLREMIRAQDLADHPLSIRLWRGLKWLQRAQETPPEDMDGRFLALWIAFNAVYGGLDEQGLIAPDRGSWQGFLARVVQADGTDRLGTLLRAQQVPVLKLIGNRYLFRPFWLGQPDWPEQLASMRRQCLRHLANWQVVPVLQELFERLYLMRHQVFHGAATPGSRLNRTTLKASTELLERFLPAMLAVMLEAGPAVDWGPICFSPVAVGDGRIRRVPVQP